jgi:putative heme iron utilization protein
VTGSTPPEYASLAREWLLSTRQAVLSTTSAHEGLEGWPFGSIVPFALSPTGAPFLLIAGIAQHTKNLRRDPRASLLVRDPAPADDPQATWRLTILGRMSQIPTTDDRFEARMARYRERVPNAPSIGDSHDFQIWEMEPERIRLIGGFGRIAWLDPDAIQLGSVD